MKFRGSKWIKKKNMKHWHNLINISNKENARQLTTALNIQIFSTDIFNPHDM